MTPKHAALIAAHGTSAPWDPDGNAGMDGVQEKFRGTPAPWVAEGDCVRDRTGLRVADCYADWKPDAKVAADARLIAAAPDMLAALKHCVIERSEWLDEARAAIAKAESPT